MRLKTIKCLLWIWHLICSATLLLEVRVHLGLKIATEAFRGCRKLWKFRFSCYFTKAKTEQCNQKDLFVFNKFGISIHCSATYFLRVGASVSLKVATKVSFRGTKIQKFSIFRAFFRKQKWRSAIDRIDLSLKNSLM